MKSNLIPIRYLVIILYMLFVKRKRLFIYLLLVGLALIWGTNFSLVKWAFSELSPLAFNAVRFTLASPLIFILLILREGWQPVPIIDMLKIFGLGLLGNSIYQVLFIKGISLTTAGNSSLFLATVPVWTAVFSVVMRKDRLNKAAWIGIVLAFIGVAIVTIGSGQKFSLSGSKTIGNLIMLLAASCWAGYTILSRDLLQRYSPLRLTALAMITGAVGLWIFAIPEVIKQSWADVSPKVWGAVAFSGIMALVVGYIIWAEGVKKIGPARTAIFSNVTPIVAFVVAFLMLGESITWLQGLGGMTILYGVSLTIRN